MFTQAIAVNIFLMLIYSTRGIKNKTNKLMFQKLVSNLPFSPALIGQLSFYAKRLRKEELTRRLGLIFTVLALVVQSFAVFQPPEAANAASNADFVHGGISSVNDFLKSYDSSPKLRSLFTSLGITRAEIKAAKSGSVGKEGYYNWSMTSLYSASQGQRAYTYYQADGTSHTVYNRPMALTQEGKSPYPVFIGHSEQFGWFALKKDCGNLITKKQPPSDTKPTTACKNISVQPLSDQQFKFIAKSNATGTAKIKSYTFVVEALPAGTVVHQAQVTTSEESATTTYAQKTPGSYRVSVVVHTSLGDRKDSDCKATFTVQAPTAAVCTGLKISKSGQNNIQMTGTASVTNAKITKYTFIIKDSTGKVVSTQTVPSAQLTASTDTVMLKTAGDYTAQLVVASSLGNLPVSAACTGKFTITPPDVCAVNPSLPVDSPDCQPCPGDSTIWIKDAECASDVIEQKTAINLDQSNASAADVLAKPSDRISYTVTVENKGNAPVTRAIQEQLEDVLQYATITDDGGGTYDATNHTLTWPEVTLQPKEKQSRTFMVRLASSIPATNTGTSDGSSYDCKMTNTFGNSIDINVECPTEKVVVEQIVGELPETGPRENMIFAGALLSIVVYFYARARQTGKEVRLIRRDINAGTI